MWCLLFQIPQRYRFSSKSQLNLYQSYECLGCFRYHKGTDFQANHNHSQKRFCTFYVVLDTTKVQIFKQITTPKDVEPQENSLFQIPQRYRFSSKSQPKGIVYILQSSCFRYHKGTDFQANHNCARTLKQINRVVLDTTKVQIFKQITTYHLSLRLVATLFQIPQRYRFSSKSQPGTSYKSLDAVVLDTTKVQIFKQITTSFTVRYGDNGLFQIPQRYRFSSKSQRES